jgi:putative membrane protein
MRTYRNSVHPRIPESTDHQGHDTKKSLRTLAIASATAAGGALLPAFAQGKLEGADASVLKQIAAANITEIETGKLATEKTKNAEIKKLAGTVAK